MSGERVTFRSVELMTCVSMPNLSRSEFSPRYRSTPGSRLKKFFPGRGEKSRGPEQRQSFAARPRNHGTVDEPKRVLPQKRGLIFERDRNGSSPGKFFIQIFPGLHRLFYVRICIEGHQGNSPKTNTLIILIVPR